jgi:hypothetical protein
MVKTHEERLAWQRAYREKNREKIRKGDRSRYEANPEKKLATNKRWADKNPDKVYENVRDWKADNIEWVREYNRSQYAVDPSRQLESNRRWAAKHPERMREALRNWRAAHPEQRRQTERAYYAADPGKALTRSNQRRATRIQRVVSWFDQNAVEAVYQLAAETGTDVDHIVPLGTDKNPARTAEGYLVSGLHWELNLQLLEPIANKSKGNRMRPEDQRLVEEWRPTSTPRTSRLNSDAATA